LSTSFDAHEDREARLEAIAAAAVAWRKSHSILEKASGSAANHFHAASDGIDKGTRHLLNDAIALGIGEAELLDVTRFSTREMNWILNSG
jgi:hypothetical protein